MATMKASEMAKINAQEESVDNTAMILVWAENAAKSRRRSVEVDAHLMTYQTERHLKQLGYFVDRKRKPSTDRWNWSRTMTVYVVSW